LINKSKLHIYIIEGIDSKTLNTIRPSSGASKTSKFSNFLFFNYLVINSILSFFVKFFHFSLGSIVLVVAIFLNIEFI